MAAAHNSLRGEPLYIFYDCEATGLEAETDRLIEIGAVVCTSNLSPRTASVLQQDSQFTSLCYCTHPINPESAKVLTLTLQDLRDAPTTVEVLTRFFRWIKERVSDVEQSELRSYTPVLVAHSGNLLDYPLLFNEIKRGHSLTLERTFEDLNLHYADSYTAVRQVARASYFYRDLPGLGVKDLHQALLHTPHQGHRALADALAVHNMFTLCDRTRKMEFFGELRKIVQNKRSVEFLREQVPKFKNAYIKPAKAEQLLMKGITYESVCQEYRRSPRNFVRYLRNTCGITKPKEELLEHFKYSY